MKTEKPTMKAVIKEGKVTVFLGNEKMYVGKYRGRCGDRVIVRVDELDRCILCEEAS